MKKVVETSVSIAIGAKLCKPAVIPMYPITPQTHIVEHLAEFINNGELDAELIHVESEFSAISAAFGAQATGVRTFTATASQGLALMHEMLHIVSGNRLPIVMAVANRALSAPINIWNDHQDSISARDTGWIQLYAESSQEALDTVIQAYKIAEKTLTPAMVCVDGFTLSHVFEPIDIPSQSKVNNFLPNYKPIHAYLDPKKPLTIGPVGFPDSFMQFKEAQQKAMLGALPIIKQTNAEFKKQFNRSYGDGLIETYKISDAKVAILAMGTICGTARVVVDELRNKGEKIGLIKLKCYRPFPTKVLQSATKNLKALAVIDRDISMGHEGAVMSDVRTALYGSKLIINNYIAGLGGKDVTKDDLTKVLHSLKKQTDTTWLS